MLSINIIHVHSYLHVKYQKGIIVIEDSLIGIIVKSDLSYVCNLYRTIIAIQKKRKHEKKQHM